MNAKHALISVQGATNQIDTWLFTNAFDSDALAFVEAVGSLTESEAAAINSLVLELKLYGLWSKIKAFYPFIGGSEAEHKWNLKDPRDLDAAFRATFSGGWGHSSNGVLGNGSNTFMNTYCIPLNELNLNSTHLSAYSRTAEDGNFADYGVQQLSGGVGFNNLWAYFRLSGNLAFRVNSGTTNTAGAITNTQGLITINRTASNLLNGWRNATKVAEATTVSTGLANLPIYLGAVNAQGTAVIPGNKQFASFSIGNGLSDTDVANLNTVVQNYQTSLGRNV